MYHRAKTINEGDKTPSLWEDSLRGYNILFNFVSQCFYCKAKGDRHCMNNVLDSIHSTSNNKQHHRPQNKTPAQLPPPNIST